MLEHWSRDENRWVEDLIAIDKPIDRAIAMDGTVEDWATESLLAARQAYQDPATGKSIEPGTVLGEAYYDANLPIAKRQLLRAAARLAWVLNDSLRPK
jgi:S1/P1 Nuclease